MTSYNQEKFVGPAIKSIIAQTLPDWELIVVDDGSRDRSHDIAIELAGLDRRIAAWRKQNSGHCAAINFGLARIQAGSEYLFFLDGDDLLKPRHLEATVAYLDENVETTLVCCQADQANEAGEIVGEFTRSRWVPGFCGVPRNMRPEERATPFVAFFCATGQGMSGLYRRSVFIRTEGWDLRFTRHEDTDMFCQMALLGEVHYLPAVLYTYRIHENNITRMSDSAAVKKNASFKPGGYEAFRRKWDYREPRNNRERQLLNAARRHYHGVHRPLRFLRIAVRSVAEFLKTGRPATLWWAMQCLRESLKGLVNFWVLGRFH